MFLCPAACTAVDNAEPDATYLCTSADDSDVSGCDDGFWEDDKGTVVYSEYVEVEPRAHCANLGLVMADSVDQLAGIEYPFVCLGTDPKTYVDTRDSIIHDSWMPDETSCYAFACVGTADVCIGTSAFLWTCDPPLAFR